MRTEGFVHSEKGIINKRAGSRNNNLSEPVSICKVRLLTCDNIMVETHNKKPSFARELLHLVFRFYFTCPSFEATL